MLEVELIKSLILKGNIELAHHILLEHINNGPLRTLKQLDPIIIKHNSTLAKKQLYSICKSVRNQIINRDLAKLLSATDKKTAIRIAERELDLSSEDFTNLIVSANLIGFDHDLIKFEFYPDITSRLNPVDLLNVDKDTNEFTKEGKKQFNIIKETFEKRKMLYSHWFEYENEWHCFYFDQNDLNSGHWTAGDHMHYISHLWNYDKNDLKEKMKNRKLNIDKVHIKYSHNFK